MSQIETELSSLRIITTGQRPHKPILPDRDLDRRVLISFNASGVEFDETKLKWVGEHTRNYFTWVNGCEARLWKDQLASWPYTNRIPGNPYACQVLFRSCPLNILRRVSHARQSIEQLPSTSTMSQVSPGITIEVAS